MFNADSNIGLVIAVIGIVAILIAVALFTSFNQTNENTVNNINADNLIKNFEECASAGNTVMESYPRQCITADGTLFKEKIGNELDKTDLIIVDNPRPNQIISSPLEITGHARGYWFFEASFPIVLLDSNGNNIATTLATAQDEWMTNKFIDYKAKIEFEKPRTKTGTLILKRDNPSGLPKNDDQLEIPVKF